MTNEKDVVYDENLVYEEDIESAFAECEKSLGKVGRMIYDPSQKIYYNAVLIHPKFGKLWYGDLYADPMSNDIALVALLSTELGPLELKTP